MNYYKVAIALLASGSAMALSTPATAALVSFQSDLFEITARTTIVPNGDDYSNTIDNPDTETSGDTAFTSAPLTVNASSISSIVDVTRTSRAFDIESGVATFSDPDNLYLHFRGDTQAQSTTSRTYIDTDYVSAYNNGSEFFYSFVALQNANFSLSFNNSQSGTPDSSVQLDDNTLGGYTGGLTIDYPSHLFTAVLIAGHSYQLAVTDAFGGNDYAYVNGPGTATGYLDDTYQMTISPSVAAVPEPASWAMMIGGVGLVGATLRRRQRVGVTFAAA